MRVDLILSHHIVFFFLQLLKSLNKIILTPSVEPRVYHCLLSPAILLFRFAFLSALCFLFMKQPIEFMCQTICSEMGINNSQQDMIQSCPHGAYCRVPMKDKY